MLLSTTQKEGSTVILQVIRHGQVYCGTKSVRIFTNHLLVFFWQFGDSTVEKGGLASCSAGRVVKCVNRCVLRGLQIRDEAESPLALVYKVRYLRH